VTRFIDTPKSVWVQEPEIAGDEVIEVESQDGTKTLLNFHRIPAGRTERQLPEAA
jgi:hypothetical protein